MCRNHHLLDIRSLQSRKAKTSPSPCHRGCFLQSAIRGRSQNPKIPSPIPHNSGLPGWRSIQRRVSKSWRPETMLLSRLDQHDLTMEQFESSNIPPTATIYIYILSLQYLYPKKILTNHQSTGCLIQYLLDINERACWKPSNLRTPPIFLSPSNTPDRSNSCPIPASWIDLLILSQTRSTQNLHLHQ